MQPDHIEHDAAVIGGSFAGLSAALYLARTRRRVCVIDAGAPRNRFAAHSHGFLGQDGADPQAMLATARAQLTAYPSVAFVEATASAAVPIGGGFAVSTSAGDAVTAGRLLLAFGISDDLPPVKGLAERWGTSVLHCPYCHGYEVADRRLGVLYASPMSLHQAALINEWGPTTLFLNGHELPAEAAAALDGRAVAIEREPVAALTGEGAALSAVSLASGRTVPLDALFIGAPTRLSSAIAADLGCAIDDGPLGPIIRTDGEKATTVPGVYAAGDAARAPHSVAWAVADGVTAGTAAHRAMVFGLSGVSA